ncbi:MAG: TetR/AcrR family transcriptional regulator [Pyrinomonadaceae bacterium]|nr:TetR/AcrR family transcriptional regulator [Acidobacteriota bacterium]MBK7934836.1 TetR/AcrR family transcriptional regulator [Acidobacteriota bacterium]MBP7375197.1 TetR/AcrR family transcriptional regulator [Pyrinomonadaceae bacterium]
MRDTFPAKTTREAILDATDRLLARNGYKKMTIDELAREVGIGKGSIYLHFKSKDEIALAHIDRMVEHIKERLHFVAEGGGAPDKRLREMLILRVMIRFDSVQHYTKSLNEILGSLRAQLLERRKRYFNEEARIIDAVVIEGQNAGMFIAGDSFDLSHTLITGSNSLLPYSLSAIELGAREEVVERANKLANLLIDGLRVR